MILEIAEILVKPETHADFEGVLRKAAAETIGKSEGFIDLEILRCDEELDRYCLLVHWQTKAHHVEGFKNSPLYTKWRDAVASYFAAPPVLRHFHLLHRVGR